MYFFRLSRTAAFDLNNVPPDIQSPVSDAHLDAAVLFWTDLNIDVTDPEWLHGPIIPEGKKVGISTQIAPLNRKKFSMLLPCDHIQTPPEGPFNQQALTWYGSKYPEAWILANRFVDFIRGEDTLNCVFSIRKSVRYKNFHEGPTIKKSTTYNCCFGPQDFRLDTIPSIPQGRRIEYGQLYLKLTRTTGELY